MGRAARSGPRPAAGRPQLAARLAFAPNGKTLLVGGRDGTARLWQVDDGRELAPLDGHHDELLAVAVSPSGLAAATAGEDRTAKLWDLSRGRAWATLTGHHEAITGVAFSRDGKLLATASRDGTVKLWNAATGREIAQLEVDRHQHSEVLRCVAFAPDGRTVAAGAEDDAVHVWDVANRRLLTSFSGGGGSVPAVAYTPDGRWLLAAGADGVVRRWQPPMPRPRPLYEDPIRRPLPGGKGKAAGKVGGVITGIIVLVLIGLRVIGALDRPRNHPVNFQPPMWNQPNAVVPQAALDQTFFGHNGGVLSVAVSPDGNKVLSGSYDKTVRLWNRQTGQELFCAQGADGHTQPVTAVAFSPDGNFALSASLDRTVRLWDVRPGQYRLVRTYAHPSGVTSVAFSPNGTRFVSGIGFQNMKHIPRDGQKGEILEWNRPLGVAGAVFVWKTEGANPKPDHLWVHKADGQFGDQISSVTYSGDGRHILGGCFDGSLRVWNAQTLQPEPTIHKAHEGEIFTVAAVPNSDLALTGAAKLAPPEKWNKGDPPAPEHVVRLWNVRTGQPRHQQFDVRDSNGVKSNGTLSVAVSPDGQRLLTAGFGWDIILWNLNTGQELWRQRMTGITNTVAFAPDGSFAVSGGWDGQVQVWRLPP